MNTQFFAVFYLKAGKLIVLDTINSPRNFIKARQVIPSGLSITPERIQDMNTDLFS
ncbi:MAG: 3-phenylpropionate/trans-cinnamate dioxygenase ferredoxin reductase subunit [Bermanella sp.]|jgi:3-phenylpropionate/trans-cinnamate dioxygenase ferredoxin reductase subunit